MNYLGVLVDTKGQIVFIDENPIKSVLEKYLDKIMLHPLNEGLIKSKFIGPKEAFYKQEDENLLWEKISSTEIMVIGRLSDKQSKSL